MLTLPENIPPPRRRQILNDFAEEDAALKKREDDGRWTKQLMQAFAGMIRMVRK